MATIDRGSVVIDRISDDDDCEIIVERQMIRAYAGGAVLYFQHCNIDLIDTLNMGDNVALIDADKLQYPLKIRRWREGDWFIPLGMSGRKKLSDYLINKMVSMAEKSRQFVLVSGEDIVWVIGRRLDDRFCITKSTENVLRIMRDSI